MISDFQFRDSYTIDDLVAIMAILRSEGGCPWDREQDHHSIRNNLIEESYEVVEAIDSEDPALLKEELGDLLLQVVFHSRMEEETGRFDFDDVCDGICKKLIHRHPHIFGDVRAATSAEVLSNWEQIKKEEKSQQTYASSVEAVSKALPSLMRAEKVQHRAGKSGFEYPDAQMAFGDLASEADELSEAMRSGSGIEEEVGDLLFSVVNVARLLGVDPEEALYRSTDKFIRRFSAVEKLAEAEGTDLRGCGLDTMNRLWGEAKKTQKEE